MAILHVVEGIAVVQDAVWLQMFLLDDRVLIADNGVLSMVIVLNAALLFT